MMSSKTAIYTHKITTCHDTDAENGFFHTRFLFIYLGISFSLCFFFILNYKQITYLQTFLYVDFVMTIFFIVAPADSSN